MMSTKNKSQGGTVKHFRFLSFLALAIATQLLGSLLTHAAEKEGRFHLVYLVAADNLKPGTNVMVEPVFMTDGKEIIPFYDYCRALHGVGIPGSEATQKETKAKWEHYKKTLAQRGAPDVEALRPFCHNESFTLSAEHYSLLDNLGQRLRIGKVRFKADVETSQDIRRMQLPPHMPLPGIAAITSAEKVEADLFSTLGLKSTGSRYFLMSADRMTLETIVPVRLPTQKEASILLSRAEALAMEQQGVLIERCPRGNGCENRWYPKTKKWPRIDFEGKPKLNSFLFADLDNDGTTDLAVFMQSSTRQGRPNYVGKHYWTALGFVLAGGEAVIERGTWGVAGRSAAIGNLSYLDPMVLVRPGHCSFLLTPLPDTASNFIGFHLHSLPREVDECEDKFLWKVIPVL